MLPPWSLTVYSNISDLIYTDISKGTVIRKPAMFKQSVDISMFSAEWVSYALLASRHFT